MCVSVICGKRLLAGLLQRSPPHWLTHSHTHAHTFAHTHTHTCTRTPARTHTHACTHTHTHSCLFSMSLCCKYKRRLLVFRFSTGELNLNKNSLHQRME